MRRSTSILSERSDMSIDPTDILAAEYPAELSFGIKEIATSMRVIKTKEDMDTDDSRIKLYFVSGTSGCEVAFLAQEDIRITIKYQDKAHAFRSLGRILGSSYKAENFSWNETLQFDTLGAMIDCSRGAVPTVATVMELIRFMALMGLNTLQLYMEDTYEIADEECFGLFRGAYNAEELRAIDEYAWNFGIEVWPCIQVLGHLGQVLQWPRFEEIKNNSEVLLVGLQESYVFIEKMIDAVSSVFRSKRVHLGMDEAHGIGDGKYKSMFEAKDSRQIFIDHLVAVNNLCIRRNLIPFIWSDMIFAGAGDLKGYYETSAPLELSSKLPKTVKLVYWDYYHCQPEDYTRKIKDHRDLGFEPWVAGGIWTWNRLVVSLPFTFEASKALFAACKEQKVRNVFAAVWGDDGNEYDIFSILPGLQYFADQGYTADYKIDEALLRSNFRGICGGNIDDWILASMIDQIDLECKLSGKCPSNLSKWILWQDPIYNHLEVQYKDLKLEQHFDTIYRKLKESVRSCTDKYPLNARLEFPCLLALVLRDKVFLRRHILEALSSSEPRSQISHVIKTRICPLRTNFDILWKFHRDKIWLSSYKPFGLEILELKYGAIRTRLETLHDRLERYAKGSIETLLEFSSCKPVNLLYPDKGSDLIIDFARAYTPSRALGTG